MAAQAAEFTLPAAMPCWGVAGNFAASELKKIHDDSRSLFPESIHSGIGSRRLRWESRTHSDYLAVLKRKEDERKEAGKATMDQGAARGDTNTLQAPPKSKMFMKWTVPRRLTADKEAHTLPKLEDENPRYAMSATPRLASTFPAVGLPVTPRKIHSARDCYTPMSRQSEMSRMRYNARESMPQTRHSAREPTPQTRHSAREPTPQTRHSAREPTPQVQKPGSATVIKPETPLPCYPRKTKAYRSEMVLNGFEPNKHHTGAGVQKSIDDWMRTSTEKDREAALTFFQSLAGARLVGGMPTKEQQHIQQVIKAIQREKLGGKSQPEQQDQCNLRYVRLLTPNTRANKWMHQTWHHLPTLNNTDPVVNSSSIYTTPQKHTPRHFLLHPDWV